MNNSKRMAALLMAAVLTVPQGSGILAQAAEEPETTAAAESLSTATPKRSPGWYLRVVNIITTAMEPG